MSESYAESMAPGTSVKIPFLEARQSLSKTAESLGSDASPQSGRGRRALLRKVPLSSCLRSKQLLGHCPLARNSSAASGGKGSRWSSLYSKQFSKEALTHSTGIAFEQSVKLPLPTAAYHYRRRAKTDAFSATTHFFHYVSRRGWVLSNAAEVPLLLPLLPAGCRFLAPSPSR